ncbi:alpha/beta fold hydrolase [uncultured Bradyrhizobium sp.]|uniref:alpha/beta fold hydrolase n=1 Tax=uncultured Bradyrhizobium sp. TaxID=199684 RepID=UPI0035CA280B
MSKSAPILLLPGLNASARLYAEQIPYLWRFGSVMVPDHTRDDTIAAIATRILADAPPRFALIGHSMGGYIAFEIMRQAAERVDRLALLDTSARSDTPEQTKSRLECIAMAEQGRLSELNDNVFPVIVHESRYDDMALRAICDAMSKDIGPAAYVRQHKAIVTRPDSRSTFAAIHCPTLVLVGDSDLLTPPDLAEEIAAEITAAQFTLIPTCGHLSTLEQPALVNTALANWLAA